MAAFYFGALWPIIVITANYIGTECGLAAGTALWFVAAAALSLPWFALWSGQLGRAACGTLIAMMISAAPPLGCIGLASPLMSAGALFPSCGWVGLLLALTIPSAAVLHSRLTLAVTAGMAITTNLLFQERPPVPDGWHAVQTSFTDSTAGGDFSRLQWLKKMARQSPALVTVFPESTVANWTEATELFWKELDAELAVQGRTVVFGATRPTVDDQENVVLIRGEQNGTVRQRLPVPVAMWNPFSNDSYRMEPTGSAIFRVRSTTAAFIICYEQFVPWPFLLSLIHDPDVLVAVANERWNHYTPLRRYSEACRTNWSRLFHIPVIFAGNAPSS